ncbi:MAG: glycoside hydrolase family 3 N-terminal domain-containing protein [Gemmatimonadaceae bacterium]
MADVAQLLIGTIRWDPVRGYDAERASIDRAIGLGAGGFLIHGGTDMAVRALTADLQRRSSMPLLIGAGLERGAGQQFAGATGLPPLAAIATLGDADAIRRAARLTAREARSLGINWCLAPACDGDVADASAVAAEWIDACQAEGVLACAKCASARAGEPSRTQLELPITAVGTEESARAELAPFIAASDAGVACVMPARLDANVSRLLRAELGFDGLIVARAPATRDDATGSAAVAALGAGCDLCFGAPDLAAAVRAIETAVSDGVLDAESLRSSRARRARWAAWSSPAVVSRDASSDRNDGDWSRALAERCVSVSRGAIGRVTSPVDVIVVDDGAAAGAATLGAAFIAELRDEGFDATRADVPSRDGRRSTVIALFGGARDGYSAETRRAVAQARAFARDAVVVQFAPPGVAAESPKATAIVSAWSGDDVMQRAAARRLVKGA